MPGNGFMMASASCAAALQGQFQRGPSPLWRLFTSGAGCVERYVEAMWIHAKLFSEAPLILSEQYPCHKSHPSHKSKVPPPHEPWTIVLLE